jgi:hypothetical protein
LVRCAPSDDATIKNRRTLFIRNRLVDRATNW